MISNKEKQNSVDEFQAELKQLQTLLVEATDQIRTDEEREILIEQIAKHRRHLDQLEEVLRIDTE